MISLQVVVVLATFFLVNISAFVMATAASTSDKTLEIPKEKISFDVWYHIAQVSV